MTPKTAYRTDYEVAELREEDNTELDISLVYVFDLLLPFKLRSEGFGRQAEKIWA